MFSFDLSKIENIEFTLCLEENEETFYDVPTDTHIKDLLKEMLIASTQEFQDKNDVIEYQFSEKYSSKERLIKSVSSDEMRKIKGLFDLSSSSIDPDKIKDSEKIKYYISTFWDKDNKKIVGVRRASYFKATLKNRNRLIKWIDDTLKTVEDTLFKLDYDFDFLITEENILILRPGNFENIAAIDESIQEKIDEKTQKLSIDLNFIDFSTITNYVKEHKRGARLISSICARDDIDKMVSEKIESIAGSTGVKFEKEGGKIKPFEGYELAFLELLDRRRYTIELTDNEEAYIAPSRREIKK